MLMIVGTASVQTSFFTGVCVIRLNLSCVVSSRFTRLHIPIISEEYSIMQVKEDVKPCSATSCRLFFVLLSQINRQINRFPISSAAFL